MIRTSHVGSFPLPHSWENVASVLRDLSRIGIDAPPYPQLRVFTEILLDPLVEEGILAKKKGFYFLLDRNRLRDLEHLEPRVPEAEYAVDCIRRGGYRFEWLRGPVAGPFTLASRIYMSENASLGLVNTLIKDRKSVEALAGYVRKNLEYLFSIGYNLLFLDEPILSIIVGKKRILFGYSSSYISEIINHILTNLPGEHGIHVCGSLPELLYQILLSTEELNILNFEFHDSPKNRELLDPDQLATYSKKIAPGIASSKKPVLESVEELENLLVEIGEKTSWNIDLVSADCGFGGLRVSGAGPYQAYEVSLEKLSRIKQAVERVVKGFF